MAIYKEVKRQQITPTGDRMYGVTKDWLNTLSAIRKSTRIDAVANPAVALCEGAIQNDIQAYYKRYAFNADDPAFNPKFGGNPEKMQEIEEEMNLYYENDRQAMLEAQAINGFNPTMTFTPPLHKDILMNCVWHQGIIPRLVTNTPDIPVEREVLLLVDPTTGEKFDMFQEQYKISQAMNNCRPIRRIACAFPENNTTDFLGSLFGVSNDLKFGGKVREHLDTNAHISGLIASIMVQPGESYTCLDEAGSYRQYMTDNSCTIEEAIAAVNAAAAAAGGNAADIEANFVTKVADSVTKVDYAIIPVRMITYPIIGDSNRTGFNHEVEINIANATGDGSETAKVLVSGIYRDDRLQVMTNDSRIKGLVFTCRQAASTGTLPSPRGEWIRKTHMERIPEATHVQATVSPEEMKDVSVLYNVNQVTKHMSFFSKIMENNRDDVAKEFLDESFEKMPWRHQMSHVFNFIPEYQFVDDHIEWARKAFLPDLDTYVTQMLNIYNDGNVIVNVVGRSDIIRKLTPTNYTWSTPSSVGPFQLDFVKTVQTSDNRTYQFISSDKMRDQNNLIVILTPKNSERFMYRIYDYQTYVSNELRSPENVYLPAITAFDRWGIFEYMPVQARINCVNVMGHSAANFDDNMAQVGGYDVFTQRTRGLNDWGVINPTGASVH